jgi:hypothetical protein
LNRSFVHAAYHQPEVHLRRAILLFALVLGLTALAAAVSPSRKEPEPAIGLAPATPVVTTVPRNLTFAQRESGAPQVRSARAGQHVVLTVPAREGGIVTIPLLGRTATVSPATPARFDLVAPPRGRYDVMFEPSGSSGLSAEPQRVGTLITQSPSRRP